jgi:hypothetical protein
LLDVAVPASPTASLRRGGGVGRTDGGGEPLGGG